jgi:hypothetical protein
MDPTLKVRAGKEGSPMKKTLAALTSVAAILVAPAFAQDVEIEIEKKMLLTYEGRSAVLEMLEEQAYDSCRADHSLRRRAGMVRSCAEDLFDQLVASLEGQSGSYAPAFASIAKQ